MASNADPLKKIEAQTLLQNLKAKAALDDFGKALDALFEVKAPQLKEITTAAELKSLIAAIEAGAADNNRLAKFIGIANNILNKI